MGRSRCCEWFSSFKRRTKNLVDLLRQQTTITSIQFVPWASECRYDHAAQSKEKTSCKTRRQSCLWLRRHETKTQLSQKMGKAPPRPNKPTCVDQTWGCFCLEFLLHYTWLRSTDEVILDSALCTRKRPELRQNHDSLSALKLEKTICLTHPTLHSGPSKLFLAYKIGGRLQRTSYSGINKI